ncbi:MAG TPA: endolytic transglycosylase MltG [Bryobacteraceae bacterium]|jgi:UPF0755 protein|nr:endolytic transglycosylase MltG [Bryobacteraceae bacterium]
MKIALRIAAVLLVCAAAAGVWFERRLNARYAAFQQPVFIEFARGTSTREMASVLASKGVIEQPWLFLAVRGLRRGASLQAGEYKFEKPASPMEVFARIARGDIFYLEVLVPEGFNMFDIAGLVGKLGTIKPEAFLAAARDPSSIRDLDPHAPSLEGYLFPSKYRLLRRTTAQQLCRMMTAEFRKRWEALHSSANLHDTITLASLIEREARLPAERPVVGSVFSNRLRIGMKLDCDPTTVYAALLENRYRGTIYRSDLASESLWNTYKHSGLPPGPIANPGVSSIQAALAPAQTPYLYFVAKADGSGGHNFSESLVEHEAAVAHYQNAVRQ